MSTLFKFPRTQSLLKGTSLFATLTIAISAMTVRSLQAQTGQSTPMPTLSPTPLASPSSQSSSQFELAPEAEVTYVEKVVYQRVASKEPSRVTVECPANTMAIAGGGSVYPADRNAFVKDSFPVQVVGSDPYPRAWTITGINRTVTDDLTFVASALCAQVREMASPMTPSSNVPPSGT
jgi:hypothetical protein